MGRRSRELATRRATGARRTPAPEVERNTIPLFDGRGRFVGYMARPEGRPAFVTTPSGIVSVRTGASSSKSVGRQRISSAHASRMGAIRRLSKGAR